MGFFESKKSKSQPKMKTLKMDVAPVKKARASKKASRKGAGKPMDFSDWVDHYVQMSNGNPV